MCWGKKAVAPDSSQNFLQFSRSPFFPVARVWFVIVIFPQEGKTIAHEQGVPAFGPCIGGKVYDVRHRGKNEDWLLSGASASGYVHEFKCSRVLADGLLVEGEGAYYGDIPEAQGKVVEVPLFFLTNYPHFDQVTEGEKLKVVALRTGSYTFKDSTGQLRRIKTYDCGTPLKPRSF